MVEIARALYRYAQEQPGDLSFEADDIIRVIAKNDSGWWTGQLDNGKTGEFPYNFVEIISEEERSAILNTRRVTTEEGYHRTHANDNASVNRIQDVTVTATNGNYEVLVVVKGGHNIRGLKSMEDFRKLDHNLHSLIEKFDSILPPVWADKIKLNSEAIEKRCNILRQYLKKLTGSELLEYAIVMWVEPNNKFKASPSIKLEYQKKSTTSYKGVTRNDPELAIRNAPALARVEYDWDPHDYVELALQKDEVIAVLSRHTESPGWWEGETTDGKRGLFPYNHVQLLSENQAEAVVMGNSLSTLNPNFLRAMSPAQPQRPQKQRRQQAIEENFFVRTTESFEYLLHHGYTIEVENKILRPDESKARPQSGDVCELSFRGYIWNCQTQQIVEFSSSDLPNNQNKTGPMRFKMSSGEVIKGIEQGVSHMSKGQQARLIITPKLAYGDVGNPPEKIPPSAFLIYDLTLDSFGSRVEAPASESVETEKSQLKTNMKDAGSPRGIGMNRTPWQSPSVPTSRNKNVPEGVSPMSPVPQTLAEAVARRARKQPQTNFMQPIQDRPTRKKENQKGRQVEQQPNDTYVVKKFPLKRLQEIVFNRDFDRAQVNPKFVEDYLDDADFEATFKMTRDNFLLLPRWQQINLKKQARLYV